LSIGKERRACVSLLSLTPCPFFLSSPCLFTLVPEASIFPAMQRRA